MSRTQGSNSGNELAGIVVILFGMGLLLNSMGILPFWFILSRYWMPALFLAIGLALLLNARSNEAFLGGLLVSGFAVLTFLNVRGPWSTIWWTADLKSLLIPAVLVWIGAALLMNSGNKDAVPAAERQNTADGNRENRIES